ncbi:hypothetical protein [Clostridium sp. Marseille-Q2269]|nr:hypothetical protein [Clostridium sp. Marseille-Q2269]
MGIGVNQDSNVVKDFMNVKFILRLRCNGNDGFNILTAYPSE